MNPGSIAYQKYTCTDNNDPTTCAYGASISSEYTPKVKLYKGTSMT